MPLTLSPAITHTRRLRSGSIRHLRSVSPSPTPLQRPDDEMLLGTLLLALAAGTTQVRIAAGCGRTVL